MKKFNAIKKSVAIVVAALALTLLAQGAAFAAEGVFEDMGIDLNGRIVVVTDPRGGTAITLCSRELLEYKAVIIDPAGGPALVTEVAILAFFEVSAGDRFDISSSVTCNGAHIATKLTLK